MVKLTYMKVNIVNCLLLCQLPPLTGTGVCGQKSEGSQPMPLSP